MKIFIVMLALSGCTREPPLLTPGVYNVIGKYLGPDDKVLEGVDPFNMDLVVGIRLGSSRNTDLYTMDVSQPNTFGVVQSDNTIFFNERVWNEDCDLAQQESDTTLFPHSNKYFRGNSRSIGNYCTSDCNCVPVDIRVGLFGALKDE